MKTRLFILFIYGMLIFGNLIGPNSGVAFASGEECSWISEQRNTISNNFPQVKLNCGESFKSALECCLNPDTCSSGGVLGGFGGQAINDAAKNVAANGAMLGQAAQMAQPVALIIVKLAMRLVRLNSKPSTPQPNTISIRGIIRR